MTNNPATNKILSTRSGVLRFPTETAKIVSEEKELLVIMVGDSNSGGKALNTQAHDFELANRPEVQILNTDRLRFEDLNIGTNNNLDHLDLDSTTHGIELELANSQARGELQRSVYYVQTGQGSSSLTDWAVTPPDVYECWPKFLERVRYAKKELPNAQVAVWITIGQNDKGDSVPVATFKTELKSLINRILVEVGTSAVVILGTIPDITANDDYNAAFVEIGEEHQNVTTVSFTDPTTTYRDTFHWDYDGFKLIANRVIKATKDSLAKTTQLTWTSSTFTIEGVSIKPSAAGQFAHVKEEIDISTDGVIVNFHLSEDGGGALIFALDTDVTEVAYSSDDPLLHGLLINPGGIYYPLINMSGLGSPFTDTEIVVLRYVKEGDDLILQSSPDNITWTTRITTSSVLSGLNTLRIKATSVGANPTEALSWINK